MWMWPYVYHFMDLSIIIKKKLFFYFHLCLWAVYGIVAQFHVAEVQYWIQPMDRGKKAEPLFQILDNLINCRTIDLFVFWSIPFKGDLQEYNYREPSTRCTGDDFVTWHKPWDHIYYCIYAWFGWKLHIKKPQVKLRHLSSHSKRKTSDKSRHSPGTFIKVKS